MSCCHGSKISGGMTTNRTHHIKELALFETSSILFNFFYLSSVCEVFWG